MQEISSSENQQDIINESNDSISIILPNMK